MRAEVKRWWGVKGWSGATKTRRENARINACAVYSYVRVCGEKIRWVVNLRGRQEHKKVHYSLTHSPQNSSTAWALDGWHQTKLRQNQPQRELHLSAGYHLINTVHNQQSPVSPDPATSHAKYPASLFLRCRICLKVCISHLLLRAGTW